MPNDKIEEIKRKHAMHVYEGYEDNVNDVIGYLLQLVEQQQAESEKWEKEARLQYRLFNEMMDKERQSREENERLRGELEQIKAEYADERASHNEHMTELIEKDKVLEWIRDAGVDYQSINKARDVISRYKRGDGADGQSD